MSIFCLQVLKGYGAVLKYSCALQVCTAAFYTQGSTMIDSLVVQKWKNRI